MSYFVAALCGLSILVAQYFYGGIFRPVFIFASYAILVVTSLLTAVCVFSKKQDLPRTSSIVITTILAGWITVRAFASVGSSQYAEMVMLVLGCFILYLSMAYGAVSTKARLFFVTILAIGALIQAILAGGQFFGIWGGAPQGWLSEQLRIWYDKGGETNVYHRAHGFYINGNHLAWFLNAAGLIALAIGGFGRGSVAIRILWIYFGGLFLVVSLACLSRGGLLAAAAGIVFIFVFSAIVIGICAKGRRIASFTVLLGAFIVPLGIMILTVGGNSTILARASVLFQEQYRIQVWLAAFREFQLAPWVGSGASAFASYARQFRLGISGTDEYFAHNDWLQIAADYGTPALFLLLGCVGMHICQGSQASINWLKERPSGLGLQSDRAALLVGSVAAVMAFGVHSLFDFNMQLPANAMLASGVMGLLANSEYRRRGSNKEGKIRLCRYVGVVLLCASGLTLCIMLWTNRGEFARLRAENYMLRGDWGMACEIAEEGRTYFPENYAFWYLEGVSRQKQAQLSVNASFSRAELERAADAFLKAVQVAPRERSAQIELSRTLMLAGKFKDAKKAAFEVIGLEPRQVTGYELYGGILEAEGDFEAARRVYQLGAILNNSEFLRERLEALGKNVENLP